MELVDVKTLAKLLHVQKQTVLSWARRGIIPSHRLSQRPVLFVLEEVKNAMKEKAAKDMDVG